MKFRIKYFMLCIYILMEMSNGTFAQIKGIIKDEKGETLPYATIYIENTSTGTVSNAEGEYELEITAPGKYNITYQYVGYKKAFFTVDYNGKPINKNIILTSEDNIIGELVISANREDPAYQIIREAIKKREYHKELVKSLEADLYVKGVVKIIDAPKEFFGEKIGDLNGILDSTRQGIVYLSESQSKFFYQAPNRTKEIMISTVKSGDNSLFTANQFSWASFDLYNEYLHFSRSIVSPIADNALSHYNYKLENSTIDKDGYTINKIRIIPKSSTSPLLNGYIYITDEYWSIYSVDLRLFGNVLKNTFLDTIEVKQVYIPVNKPTVWRLFSQVFSFKAGLFGFKMGGNFTYIFSNYNLDPDVSSYFTNHETFKVESTALKIDSAFWQAQRPIPLTPEEQRDYIKKDSLQQLWKKKSYMDSIDMVNNKLSVLKILTGYSRENSYKKTTLSFPSPLSTVRFNAVEGLKLVMDAVWNKEDSLFRKWTIEPTLEYGFADNIFKPRIFAEYRFDNYTLGKVSFAIGRRYQQFEPRNPINERNNSWSSLWGKENRIRLFQNEYLSFGYAQELSNGLYIDINSLYTNRSPLSVNTQYSFRSKDSHYEPNIPRPDLDPSVYESNEYAINTFKIILRPAQKFSSYPNLKIRDVSDWPNITAVYENGLPISKNGSTFHKLTMKIKDTYVNARLLGYFSYNLEVGSFINSKPSFFGDYFHPLGNELASPISPEIGSFNLMPYYEFSTAKHYFQVNFRHHFNGFVFDKIPLINKTPLKLVVGFSALYQPEKGQYLEPFLGFENFRIGPIHLFDLDYSFAFDKTGLRDQGITVRLSQFLNQ